MQLYAHDFSEFTGLDVGEDGRFSGGTPIVSCWVEPFRHAYFVRAEGRIAGFAIVDERSRLTGDPEVADMAEFFVLRKYRRKGVGARAAALAFARFARRWAVRQAASNVAATAFWRRTIAAYTGGAFREVLVDDGRWRGPVQSFGGGLSDRAGARPGERDRVLRLASTLRPGRTPVASTWFGRTKSGGRTAGPPSSGWHKPDRSPPTDPLPDRSATLRSATDPYLVRSPTLAFETPEYPSRSQTLRDRP
jgi:predicted acetyltransferase